MMVPQLRILITPFSHGSKYILKILTLVKHKTMFQKSSVYMQTFTFLYYQNSPDNPFLRLMVTQDGQNEE